MDRKEIEYKIKTQRFKAHSLWCVFSDPSARDGMMIQFGFWEGPAEYRAIEFPENDRMYFIKTSTFDELRTTCQDCGSKLRDDNNFLKPAEHPDIFICGECGSVYESKFGSPLTKKDKE